MGHSRVLKRLQLVIYSGRKMRKWLSSVLCALPFALLIDSVTASTCVISPLGHGKDDTDQVCSSSVTY